MAIAVQHRTQTTSLRSIWADALTASACVTLIPDATHLLPLVPLLLVAPRIADRIAHAWLWPPDARFVPDPQAPDWAALASGLSAICQEAERQNGSKTLGLSPFFNPDTSPRPYLLEVIPQRKVLRIREAHAKRFQEYPFPYALRLRLPQPLVVSDKSITVQVTPVPTTRLLPQFSLSQCQPNPIAERAWFIPVVTLLLLPMGWRWSVTALLSLLIPPLSRLIVGGAWHPFRHAPTLSRHPQSLPFDFLRIWVGILALIRWAAPASWPGYMLHDGIAFLFWSLVFPALLHSGIQRVRYWHHRKTRKPS